MTRSALPAAVPGALAALLVLVLGVGVAPVFLEPGQGLTKAVSAALAETRVENPVTAVLLDFRGYDTLLEVGVLLVAWLGGIAANARSRTSSLPRLSSPIACTLAGLLVAPAILLAAYLLWAGTDAPGGAFQAGAVGAAGIITWRLGAHDDASWNPPLPAAVAPVGFAVVLGVAVVVTGATGTFMDYPLPVAREAMMLIEAAIALSVAAILAALFDAVVGAGHGT